MKVIQNNLELCGIVMDERTAFQVAPLSLAYVGDTVFDLYVRTWLVREKAGDVGKMHKIASSIVNAAAQAKYAHEILPQLTEQEKDIFMRGRNAKTNTTPKNMSAADYHYATALEAVVGFLYLRGQIGRIQELLRGLQALDDEDETT